MNAASLVTKAAREHPAQVAVRDDAEFALTYAQLDEAAVRFGGGLRTLGLKPGDRVAIYMSNRPAYVIAMLGALKAGFSIVPVNVRLHARELRVILEDSEPSALVYGADQRETVREAYSTEAGCFLVESGIGGFEESVVPQSTPLSEDEVVEPEDLAWLFYTSGTTGRPKGAMLTHRNLLAATMNCLADVCDFRPTDTVLHVAPLSHGSGLYLFPALARGTENIIASSARAEDVLSAIEQSKVTVLAFVAPTTIVMMVGCAEAFDTTSLKTVIYGGAPIHVEQLRAARDRFGSVLVQIYGQGESPMTISSLSREEHLSDDDGVLASVGRVRTDVEVRILDSNELDVPVGDAGEIAVRGDVVMRGYWRNAQATAEVLRGGWLHTGDIGRFVDGSRLQLLDRRHDMIITGGFNVYPREVEDALMLHHGVREAAVFGVADAKWGEAIFAAVVPESTWASDETELIEHCRAHIASFKKPSRIHFIDALPRSAYGKVLKRELRHAFEDSINTSSAELVETTTPSKGTR
jgi:long-chain acyl-CoA synthetase